MKWITYFSLLLILGSCSQQAPLSGKLELTANSDWSTTVYLIQPRSLDEVATSYTGTILDSAKVTVDGNFSFEQLPDSTTPILLELAVQKKGERFLNKLENENLLTANYFPIVWKNGIEIEITAKIDSFQSSFISTNPSAENAAIHQLRDIRLAAYQQNYLNNDPSNHSEDLILEKEITLQKFRQPLITFANNTEHMLPALLALRWVSPQNDFERVPEFIVNQCQQWQTKNSKHPWVNQLCQKGENLPILKGTKLPDFPLPMRSGDTITIYQLKGQQLTLVDLWASWCVPCRKENKAVLVPLWEKYHLANFQIIGYALDSDEDNWKKAIETDGVHRWPQASHLRGDDAPLLDTLKIQTIPANLLIDKEGKVVAKNLHGKELFRFVEEYLMH